MSEGVVWDALRGGLVTRALALVAHLRIPERLVEGPRAVPDLAREAGADPDTLHRLLRALASDGIFAEDEPGVFRNTSASALLAGSGWGEFADLFGGVWLRTVAELGVDGKPTFPRLYGTDFWSWLQASPVERAAFDRAMEQGWERRLERLDSVAWRGDETVVDVGGGNGSLLLALLGRHPGLHGIVFDLPETVRDESVFGDRCAFVTGNFFETVPAGDVFVLSTILHDWDDDAALRILRTIRTAADDDARLVLLESVVHPGNESDGAKWLDLLMLALAGGRERDEQQWRALLNRGGFRVERIEPGIVEAAPTA